MPQLIRYRYEITDASSVQHGWAISAVFPVYESENVYHYKGEKCKLVGIESETEHLVFSKMMEGEEISFLSDLYHHHLMIQGEKYQIYFVSGKQCIYIPKSLERVFRYQLQNRTNHIRWNNQATVWKNFECFADGILRCKDCDVYIIKSLLATHSPFFNKYFTIKGFNNDTSKHMVYAFQGDSSFIKDYMHYLLLDHHLDYKIITEYPESFLDFALFLGDAMYLYSLYRTIPGLLIENALKQESNSLDPELSFDPFQENLETVDEIELEITEYLGSHLGIPQKQVEDHLYSQMLDEEKTMQELSRSYWTETNACDSVLNCKQETLEINRFQLSVYCTQILEQICKTKQVALTCQPEFGSLSCSILQNKQVWKEYQKYRFSASMDMDCILKNLWSFFSFARQIEDYVFLMRIVEIVYEETSKKYCTLPHPDETKIAINRFLEEIMQEQANQAKEAVSKFNV
jgi:hypothetical protein